MQICIDTRSRTPSDRQKMQRDCWKSNYYLSSFCAVFINNKLVMYTRAQDIRFDREL